MRLLRISWKYKADQARLGSTHKSTKSREPFPGIFLSQVNTTEAVFKIVAYAQGRGADLILKRSVHIST
jgi:hypothetical protein